MVTENEKAGRKPDKEVRRMHNVQCHDEEQTQTAVSQTVQKVHVGFVKRLVSAAFDNHHI